MRLGSQMISRYMSIDALSWGDFKKSFVEKRHSAAKNTQRSNLRYLVKLADATYKKLLVGRMLEGTLEETLLEVIISAWNTQGHEGDGLPQRWPIVGTQRSAKSSFKEDSYGCSENGWLTSHTFNQTNKHQRVGKKSKHLVSKGFGVKIKRLVAS
ncbi:hypothetical protein PanWU01x14_301270 [Parasponia andersonii]|uniref:Uncharacterized protein n=1 Tax=Parasponia andersonii TaxID=3476 RepID=A0A2P5ATS9_PARAD|nr:hypothetical protein PanWU01x14_301270 [Parasponia andersonii]